MGIKRIILKLFLVFLTFHVSGQEDVKDSFIQRINASYAVLETLKSDFKQTKSLSIMEDDLISTGKFYYQKPNLMKWDQQHPEPYYFIINENEIIRFNGEKKQKLPSSSPQAMVFKKFILGTVDGTLFSDDSFESTFSLVDQQIQVILIPEDKNLKKRMNKIILLFNNESLFLNSLTMEEKGGDKTIIQFFKQELNSQIDSNTFK